MHSLYYVMKKSHFDSISASGVRGEAINSWKASKEGTPRVNSVDGTYCFVECINRTWTMPNEIVENIIEPIVIDDHYDFPADSTDSTVIQCNNFILNNFIANSNKWPEPEI